MGLDQYLSIKKRISGHDFNDKVSQKKYKSILKSVDVSEKDLSPDSRSVTVSIEVAYWRKANAIHKWFVDNVQEGNDDCGSYWVSPEKLQELIDLCEKVLKTKNYRLLPPQSGFFFGSTEVDDWYWDNIQETFDTLSKVIERFPESGFYYKSSW